MNESTALMEIKQMLVTLTTALVTMATKVEQLSQDKALQVATMSAQPSPGPARGTTPLPSLHR